MNLSKYNKFKSYLDITIRAFIFYSPYACRGMKKKVPKDSLLHAEFYEIQKIEVENILLRLRYGNFGIYELEMDQRLSVSDELSLKLMADDASLPVEFKEIR